MTVKSIQVTNGLEEAMPATTMRAIVNEHFGPPEVLELREVPRPVIQADGVLVRVRAASVNPLDWHSMRGEPYFSRLMGIGLRRPKSSVRGVDVAGIVEAVGSDVTAFRPGDEVFGARSGSFAEYVAGRERNFVAKPAGLTFEQAAAIPVAGVTALQGLRDRGQLQAGQRVLINGAAGGVGTFAVQIARAFGAQVTGVCSARNVEMVRSIGAEEVIDYAREDFTRSGQRYDLILDNIGNHSLNSLRRVTTADGTIVLVGAGSGRWITPLPRIARAMILSRFVGQTISKFFANITADDLLVLRELVEAGKLTAVVDRTYPLAEAAEALRYSETGHARAKIVITV